MLVSKFNRRWNGMVAILVEMLIKKTKCRVPPPLIFAQNKLIAHALTHTQWFTFTSRWPCRHVSSLTCFQPPEPCARSAPHCWVSSPASGRACQPAPLQLPRSLEWRSQTPRSFLHCTHIRPITDIYCTNNDVYKPHTKLM